MTWDKMFVPVLIAVLSCSSGLHAQTMKAGTGRKQITPTLPFMLTGYAARTTPAAEKAHELWAKALVIEAPDKSRIAIITTDILGLTPEIQRNVTDSLGKKYGLQRSNILLNSSHTHSGPFIWPALGMIGDPDSTSLRAYTGYSEQLTVAMIESVDMAFQSLQNAELFSAHGEAEFAKNRRQITAKGVSIGINPSGAVDHAVPVLKAETTDGKIIAILFGYACHNTTVTATNNIINGDYAGYAQIELEKKYPGATALFFLGCAGDQNPQPRGTVELAAQHGKELADAVHKALSGKITNVRGPVKAKLTTVELDLEPYTIQQYREHLKTGSVYQQRRAKLMIEALNRGWKIDKYQYPVQAFRIGKSLTMVSLAGEVVVGYALAIKQAYPSENLFVAGYCNEVICYIPTKKILEEGGYEAVDNMIYYGMSGPFAKTIEAKILEAVRSTVTALGLSRSDR